jgi:hypothetical protein
MGLSNFEKWQTYMSWCVSPDNYIDFGFYNLITSALQRRVYGGPKHSPLYPNTYSILVGEPGVGKGLVIREVTKIIKHHKLKDPREKKKNIEEPISESDKLASEILQKEEFKDAQEKEDIFAKKHKWYEKPLLIPVAADATTYEALVLEMARSKRLLNYPDVDAEGKPKLGIYTHSSLSFCLEEMSSLFRKRMEDLIHFLIQAYDCGDYNYETIKRGKDRVRNCCLNILGGTTPGFMQNMFNDAIISEGFASRTFFIFATKNRKTCLRIPDLTAEQISYREDIIKHVEKLTTLYGNVQYTDEAWTFLEDWWNKSQHERPNISARLNPYYARKNIHVQKIAMALHFSEHTSMEIGVDTFQKALEILGCEEKKMHYCLGLDNTNPLAHCSRKIDSFVSRNGSAFSFQDLLAEFWSSLPSKEPKEDLNTIMEHLIFSGSIMSELRKNPRTGQELVYYFSKKQSEI